jgi:hypothetical protein
MLRVHRSRYISPSIIDEALVVYHLAFVPVFTAAHLVRGGPLGSAKYEQIDPDTLQRAMTMRSLLLWHQEVGKFEPLDDDVSFVFGTVFDLRRHLKIQTIDKDFENQGLYPKLLLKQAIKHAHTRRRK